MKIRYRSPAYPAVKVVAINYGEEQVTFSDAPDWIKRSVETGWSLYFDEHCNLIIRDRDMDTYSTAKVNDFVIITGYDSVNEPNLKVITFYQIHQYDVTDRVEDTKNNLVLLNVLRKKF